MKLMCIKIKMSATSDNESEIDVEKLLYEVRKRPILYDTRASEFQDTNFKENSWNGIGNLLGAPGRECVKLFLRLRRNNARQEKKIKDAKKSGASGNALPRPYKWANQLSFLVPFVKKRRSATNLKMKLLKQRDAAVMTDDDEEDYFDDTSLQESTQTTISSVNNEQKSSKMSKSKRKSEGHESEDDLILQHIKQNRDSDSDEMFLRSLVPDLKSLDEKKKCFLKTSFQRLNFVARFGDLKDVQNLVQSEIRCLCPENCNASTSQAAATNYQPTTYYNGQTYLNL